MFQISARGDERIVEIFSQMTPSVREKFIEVVPELALGLQDYIVGEKLSGQVLNQRTGALARSIYEESPIVDGQDGMRVSGKVGQSGDVVYGRIHEYGGEIEIPEIFPVTAKALSFVIDGRRVTCAKTRAHTVTMPERSFMRSGLADQSAEISLRLKAAYVEGLQASVRG